MSQRSNQSSASACFAHHASGSLAAASCSDSSAISAFSRKPFGGSKVSWSSSSPSSRSTCSAEGLVLASIARFYPKVRLLGHGLPARASGRTGHARAAAVAVGVLAHLGDEPLERARARGSPRGSPRRRAPRPTRPRAAATPRGGTGARRRACRRRPGCAYAGELASSVAPGGQVEGVAVPLERRERLRGVAEDRVAGCRGGQLDAAAARPPPRRPGYTRAPSAAASSWAPRQTPQTGCPARAASPIARFSASEPRVRVLLVGAHRPAHDDQPVELAPVGQRLALVELHPRQVVPARAQLVLERRRRLAGDVLEGEQGHVGDGTSREGRARLEARPSATSS